jgi:SAM-dependent methyltransferase
MSDLFTHFESQYNLLHPSERNEFFIDIVVDQIKKYKDPVVVDIGCGAGIGETEPLLWKVRNAATKLIGIEPDTQVKPRMDIMDQVEHTSFEDCSIPENSVDVAFSVMVMEHVSSPQAFMEKIYRTLKPGGVYLFLTVNRNHYFGIITTVLKKLKIDELILKIVRPKAEVENYHYPVVYKFNSKKDITKVINKTRLEKPRFVFAEHKGALCYFPGFTRVIWHLLTYKRKLIRQPEYLLELICMIKKPLVDTKS